MAKVESAAMVNIAPLADVVDIDCFYVAAATGIVQGIAGGEYIIGGLKEGKKKFKDKLKEETEAAKLKGIEPFFKDYTERIIKTEEFLDKANKFGVELPKVPVLYGYDHGNPVIGYMPSTAPSGNNLQINFPGFEKAVSEISKGNKQLYRLYSRDMQKFADYAVTSQFYEGMTAFKNVEDMFRDEGKNVLDLTHKFNPNNLNVVSEEYFNKLNKVEKMKDYLNTAFLNKKLILKND